MVRQSWRGLALVAALVTSVVSHAQLFQLTPPTGPQPKTELGGTAAIDMVRVREDTPGAPLRNANVKSGSERVELGGRALRRGVDYSLDYESGVIYLLGSRRAGDILVVSYRYDASKPPPAPGERSNSFAGFRFDLAGNGGLRAFLGFGMTERTADGNVLNSNLYGLQNSFGLAGGRLKGLFFIGERQRADAKSAYGYSEAPGAVEEGKSRFMLQDFAANLAGGSVTASYQDISKNFAGFGAVRESGVDANLVEMLQRERGLKRMSFGMRDVGLGGMRFGTGYSKVGDASGSVDWRSLAFSRGDVQKGRGFQVDWQARRISPGFNRFKDLREGDREQLMREAGLNRESLAAAFRGSAGRISFNQDKIEDLAGNGIYRRSLEMFDGAAQESSRIYLGYGDQKVERGFGRVGSLTEPEKQLYGRELGISRQWTAISLGVPDRKNPLKFAKNTFRTDTGDLSSSRLSASGRSWSFERVNVAVDSGFGGLDSLPEATGADSGSRGPGKVELAKMIGDMYAPGAPGMQPQNERPFVLRSAGLTRQLERFTLQPANGVRLQLDNLSISGRSDDASVQTAALDGKGFALRYRRQEMGDRFSDLPNLLEYERQRLGTVPGLDRTDIQANFQIGANRLGFSSMNASAPEGDASRQSFSLEGKNMSVSVNNRTVGTDFSSVNQLVDPEKDILYQLRGFSERDIKAKFQMIPGFWIDIFWFDAVSQAANESKMLRNATAVYQPDKNTRIDLFRFENRSSDFMSTLFANVVERMGFQRNMGRLGNLSILQERQDFDGTQTDQPDSVKNQLTYETRLNDKTSLRTDQTQTKYENGSSESVSQNTVSTSISKNAGLSVTDVRVDRDGSDRDEKRRNYGFWLDLGKGLRFSYGFARQLTGDNNGTMTSTVVVGANGDGMRPDQVQGAQAGQVGDWSLGGAYGVNTWDSNGRTQSFSKVQVATVRPLTLGRLTDVRLNFGLDTQADFSNWLRENRLIHLSGKLGGNLLLYEYRSQMHQSGARAIDRTFKFETNQSPKNWLTAKLAYKLRTLPWDDQVMIRDYSIGARPLKNLEITHRLQTNPEGPQQDNVLLGSVPLPVRKSEWRLDYKSGDALTIGGQYDELIQEQTNSRARRGGLNVTMFQGSGSPLSLYYGVEQNDLSGSRRTVNRYHLRFDQRPGPNQVFSFFIGNESFEHLVPQGSKRNNWTIRLDYQLRF